MPVTMSHDQEEASILVVLHKQYIPRHRVGQASQARHIVYRVEGLPFGILEAGLWRQSAQSQPAQLTEATEVSPSFFFLGALGYLESTDLNRPHQ
jgi:hypothetical protein